MVYILGYGNPLRGDDGLGYVAAESLRETWGSHPDVNIETAHQLTPEIAETLSEHTYAIFLDVQATGTPGEIIEREVQATGNADSPINHQCTPESLLQSAQQLYGHASNLRMFSIVGEDYGYHESLSDTVRSQLPQYLERINRYIHKIISN